MLNHLLEQLKKDSECTKLIFMPISRVHVESVYSIGDVRVVPPGVIDLDSFRPVPNKTLPKSGPCVASFSGQDLREVATSVTGFDCNVLDAMPLVVFTAKIDWDEFLGQDHKSDIQLLRRLSAIAERTFDLVRLNFCRFDLPETLPGNVGSWTGSEAFLGAMIYTLSDHESYLIAGEAANCSIIVKGLGLELDIDLPGQQLLPGDGEVANIARHGLSLFSDVMIANSDTIKFGRAMTLLEFLASPDKYGAWKDLKGNIICHCAKSKDEYHSLSNRFKQLTSFKDVNGDQIGIRTLVVHHGRFLEDIIPKACERKSLFGELQGFAAHVLEDMLANSEMSWDSFQQFRLDKKKSLGICLT